MARFDQVFQKDNTVKRPERPPKRDTQYIHYSKLVDNDAQYCNERSKDEIETLADLIEANGGILQNVLVRKIDTDEYELLVGHKRRRAAKLLVEERGREEFAFIPCMVENISDARAKFQVFSLNIFHDKNDYEKMHELEQMKYLLETYPEEFPESLQKGRMVERLAKQTGMKRSTVGEYLKIAKDLGVKGREEFKNGTIKKGAAYALAGLPNKEQKTLIERGVTTETAINKYIAQKKGTVPEQEPEPIPPEPKPILPEEKREPDSQISGQYRVINTDMDVAEETGEAGEEPASEPELTPTQINEVMPLKPGSEAEPPMFPQLKNDEQRKEWLRDYKSWGIWYKDDNIGAVYYKYDFPDGTRLIAETYPYNKVDCMGYTPDYVPYYLHLVGGPKEREMNPYGLPKYPYHAHYTKQPDCETELVAFLKAVQKK